MGLSSSNELAARERIESGGAQRIIEVPFDAREHGVVELYSTVDVRFSLPPDRYALRFEYYPDEQIPRVRLTFIPDVNPGFAIVRADSKIDADIPLVTDAEWWSD